MSAEPSKSLLEMVEAGARRPIGYEVEAPRRHVEPEPDPEPGIPSPETPPPPVTTEAFVPPDPGFGAGDDAGENPAHREDFMSLLRKAWFFTSGFDTVH